MAIALVISESQSVHAIPEMTFISGMTHRCIFGAMKSPRPRLSYEFALVGVTIIWGVNFPIVKSALGLVGPLTFNAFRFSVSAVLLGLLYLRERHATASTPRASISWRYVVVLGVLGHFVYQMLFILGLDRTTAGNSAFLISSAPLWTAVTARLLGYERLSALAWLGLGIAFLGSATLVVGQFGVDLVGSKMIGNLLSLGGAVAWGSFTALSRPALRDQSPTALAFWTIATALPLLRLAAYFEPSQDG